MNITVKQYKKINNDKELQKSKKTLTRWFNLARRLAGFSLNAKNNEITGRCMACGKKLRLERFSDGSILNGRSFHASHFYDSDKYPNLEYYEDNVWLSCNRCNSPYGLHGNKPEYKINLLKTIGQEAIDELERRRHRIYKPNILDIDRLIFEYKDKAKREANRLNIRI